MTKAEKLIVRLFIESESKVKKIEKTIKQSEKDKFQNFEVGIFHLKGHLSVWEKLNKSCKSTKLTISKKRLTLIRN